MISLLRHVTLFFICGSLLNSHSANAGRSIKIPPVYINFDLASNTARSPRPTLNDNELYQTLDFTFSNLSNVNQTVTITIAQDGFRCGTSHIVPSSSSSEAASPSGGYVSTFNLPPDGIGGGVFTCKCLIKMNSVCGTSLSAGPSINKLSPWFENQLNLVSGTTYSTPVYEAFSYLRAIISINVAEDRGAILGSISSRIFGLGRDVIQQQSSPHILVQMNGGRPF